MSLQFLNMKGWHPSNKTNQRRIWIAEQSARDREQREQEAAAEVRQSAEQQRFQELAAAASGDPAAARRASATQQLSFMYAPPPGLPKPSDAAASADADGAHLCVCESDAMEKLPIADRGDRGRCGGGGVPTQSGQAEKGRRSCGGPAGGAAQLGAVRWSPSR